MCGIVGYVGKQESLPILIDGLRSLEYRGYDSAGVVVLSGGKAHIARAVGTVSSLEERLSHIAPFPGSVGIAHTRWATHGGVTEANAHPHADCRGEIFVVHNGIIENFAELRSYLMKKGHVFRSQTDTETLPHLIEEARKASPKKSLEESVMKALQQVKGTYGIVVCDSREPEKIVAARNFSPLLLGIGHGEALVASDASAITKITNSIVYLHDGEVATITPTGYRIRTLGNELVNRETQSFTGSTVSASKGVFKHFMLKEIHEEPDAVRNSIRGRIESGGRVRLGGLAPFEEKLRDIERLTICACGTAYLAGMVGEYMLEEYAGLATEVDLASEFRYRKPIFHKHDALLTVSQSGETADTLASLYEAKQKGVLTLGIVNAVGSTMSRETDAGIYQHVGNEIGVAATKSFVSQLSIFVLLTVYLGRQRTLSLTMGERMLRELNRIPVLMEKILSCETDIKRFAKKYSKYNNFLFIGRKYNFPIAYEGALKLKEVAYVHAEGYGAGEMKHGPIAMVGKDFPAIAIAPQDSVYEKMISNIQELKARGVRVFAIGTEGDRKLASIADDVFYIPKTLEMLTPLLTVLPLHLFAYYIGIARGFNVDKPRHLAKSVTVE